MYLRIIRLWLLRIFLFGTTRSEHTLAASQLRFVSLIFIETFKLQVLHYVLGS